MNKIRVLVVDDSPLVRNILTQGLSLYPRLSVVGSAQDVYEARDKIIELNPDVLTLDVEMPKMNGVEFLRRLMPQYPLPVVMVSALTKEGAKITFDALEAGAIDFVTKPTADLAGGITGMLAELVDKIVEASRIDVSHLRRSRNVPPPQTGMPAPLKTAQQEPSDRLIAIGASTGGTEAIRNVLGKLPSSSPGVLIVQHMPPAYTKAFAERLNGFCSLSVKEAEAGDVIRNGEVYVAPGDLHLTVIKSGSSFKTVCAPGDKVSGHCPSVNVLMNSVAEVAGSRAVGVILTGMGGDGAEGLLAMRKAGARTLAQDEASSVVFGMPKVAFERGGAEGLHPLDKIPQVISRLAAELDSPKSSGRI